MSEALPSVEKNSTFLLSVKEKVTYKFTYTSTNSCGMLRVIIIFQPRSSFMGQIMAYSLCQDWPETGQEWAIELSNNTWFDLMFQGIQPRIIYYYTKFSNTSLALKCLRLKIDRKSSKFYLNRDIPSILILPPPSPIWKLRQWPWLVIYMHSFFSSVQWLQGQTYLRTGTTSALRV